MAGNDKLSIINSALISVGRDPVTVADDNSAEWIVASNAYERELPRILSARDWKFKTGIAACTRLGASTFPGYSDIYQKPANCLHLIHAFSTTSANQIVATPSYFDARDNTNLPRFNYRLIGDQIHCADSNGISAYYVVEPSSDVEWHPMFREALVRAVEAHLERGLNNNMDGAKMAYSLAAGALDEASSRTDNQEPRKAVFRTQATMARRMRRV